MNCHACGQRIPDTNRTLRISDRELEVLSAWWLLHSVRATARFFGTAEQTVKNQLMNARRRNGFHSTSELAQAFMADLRTMEELMTQHNYSGRKAA